MATSRQHLEACLTKLRAAGLTPPKAAATADGFALHIAVWLERLARYDSRAVSAAFERWIDTEDEWPKPASMLRLVEEQQAKLEHRPAISGANPAAELSQSVNTAFGFLSNAHLRELDRLDPRGQQQIVNETGRWFLSYWREAIGAAGSGQAAMRPWIAMINEFVEAKMGKSWRQILDEELAARPDPATRVPGFKTLGEALEQGLARAEPEPLAVAAE